MCQNLTTIETKKKHVTLATHALQFIFHGLSGFRWPVAYFATSTAKAHQLWWIFWEICARLSDYGFSVDYCLVDGASTNRAFVKLCIMGDPMTEKYLATDIEDTNNKIAMVQDIKHVIKKIRNGVFSSKPNGNENEKEKHRCLILRDNLIVWEYWEEAWKINQLSGRYLHNQVKKMSHLELELENEYFIYFEDFSIKHC